jgi:hypothetical protein
MGQRALAKVKSLSGGHQYGEKAMSIFNALSNLLDGAGSRVAENKMPSGCGRFAGTNEKPATLPCHAAG